MRQEEPHSILTFLVAPPSQPRELSLNASRHFSSLTDVSQEAGVRQHWDRHGVCGMNEKDMVSAPKAFMV